MPDTNRFELPRTCDYLKTGYPLRLVYFKKTADGKHRAFTTPKDWPDMGQAEPGLAPIVEDDDGNRKNGFFGIINTEEVLQPHELDFDEIDGLEVCEEGGKIFMVKDRCLRMPLKGLYPTLTCMCDCGNLYNPIINLNLSIETGGVGGMPSYLQLNRYNPLSPIAGVGVGTSKLFQQRIGSLVHNWNFNTGMFVAVFSPQRTSWCPFVAPPHHGHPVCPFEMMDWYLATCDYHRGIHSVAFFATGEVLWDHEEAGDIQLGAKIGTTCFSPDGAPVSDRTKHTWAASLEFILPSQPTMADFPDLEDDVPFDDIGFPPWTGGTGDVSFSEPVAGGLLPCEEPCECHVGPSQYRPPAC